MTVMLLQNNVCVYSTNNNNNNNNNNNLSKSGPIRTIEEHQFGEENSSKHETSATEIRPRLNVFSLPYTGGPKREGKAMNYYRLWIYTCNAVLLVSVLGFVVVAGKVVLVDPRRSLIPGLTLHEPSLLYAYLALLTQSGLLQLLGCIGAHKLNEKLLNLYWFLLLFLLFGDAFIGVVWIFRFEKMYSDVRPSLRHRLQKEYGVSEEFTHLWDNFQNNFRCCGVEGPQDFNEIDLTRRHSGKKKNNETKGNRQSVKYEAGYADNYRNRVIVDENVNLTFKDGGRDRVTGATTSTDGSADAVKEFDEPGNVFLPTMPSSDTYPKGPNVKYVRNVPESCCRLLTEEVPDENREERKEEPQSKPTAVRQRLENKKSRNQEKKAAKPEAPCDDDSTNCKAPFKRHVSGNGELQFHGGHVRHETPFKSTHHFSTSKNAVPSNGTREKVAKEAKFSTGNIGIMNTCASINGHPVGTVYGMTETLHFSVGCEVKLKKWLRDSAHVLGVLGYCVIAFLKLCFLGILRYEIREMIQKIKMIQGELQPPILLLSTDSGTDNPETNSPTSPHRGTLCNHTDNPSRAPANLNGTQNSFLPSESSAKENQDRRLRANSLGNAFLLVQPQESGQTTPAHQIKSSQHRHKFGTLLGGGGGGDTGNDSDTNSHCALLVDGDEFAPPSKKKHSMVSSNGNNNHESHELQDLLLTRCAKI